MASWWNAVTHFALNNARCGAKAVIYAHAGNFWPEVWGSKAQIFCQDHLVLPVQLYIVKYKKWNMIWWTPSLYSFSVFKARLPLLRIVLQSFLTDLSRLTEYCVLWEFGISTEPGKRKSRRSLHKKKKWVTLIHRMAWVFCFFGGFPVIIIDETSWDSYSIICADLNLKAM